MRTIDWPLARGFVREKFELDKQAIIKAALADEDVASVLEPLLTVAQVDEFFIDTGLDEDAIKKELAAS